MVTLSVVFVGAALASTPAQIQIPKSVAFEHEQLHKELVAIVTKPGPTQAPAKRVAEALHRHFSKEEELAMPLLGLLQPLSKGKKAPAGTAKIVAQLNKEMPAMLAEHREILKHLKELEAAGLKSRNERAVSFARNLMNHARNEEEVLYPAALLVGRLVK